MFKTAVEQLEQLEMSNWTDFNSHDPGMTILEILTYSLSELDLLTDQPLEDLLASQSNLSASDLLETFPLPQRIFTAFPHTLNEYRKLFLHILDQSSSSTTSPSFLLNNVFLKSVSSRLALYFDGLQSKLSFSTSADPIFISGLYEVSPEFFDISLNQNSFQARLTDSVLGRSWGVTFFFPYWNEIEGEFASERIRRVELVDDPSNPNDPIILLDRGRDQDFFCQARIRLSSRNILIPIFIKVSIFLNSRDSSLVSSLKTALKDLLESRARTNPIFAYNLRLRNTFQKLQQVRLVYDQHRSVCEDIEYFRAPKVQEIAVNAEIEVEVDAEVEDLLSSIFISFYNFFSPVLRRFSWSEKRKNFEGSLEELLQGPLFPTGLIEDDDLIKSDQLSVIYTSDLVRLIMDLPGVLGVNFLNLSSFIENVKVAESVESCLTINGKDYYVPRFEALRSTILFKRQNRLLEPNTAGAIHVYEERKLAQFQQEVFSLPDENLASGTDLSIENYRSIQYDFPQFYFLGNQELPKSSPLNELGKNKQLKGYLSFFDQILADHKISVANLAETFSLNKTENQITPTYNLQTESSLEEILPNNYSKEFDLRLRVLREFFQERNKVLNHLGARYAKDLIPYERTNRGIFGAVSEERILRDKELFLIDFPLFSEKSSQGLQITLPTGQMPEDRWDTLEISGYEHNLKRHLGIRTLERSSLIKDASVWIKPKAPQTTFPAIYQLSDKSGIPILESMAPVADLESAIAHANEFFRLGIDQSNYLIEGASNGFTWKIKYLNASGNEDLEVVDSYSSQEEAEKGLREIQKLILETWAGEGMFLLEHILLRPQKIGDDDQLLNPIGKLKDPYSFVLSVVFPSGYAKDFTLLDPPLFPTLGYNRFRDKEFRSYVDEIVQQESPAHCLTQVFFLDEDIKGDLIGKSFNRFEDVYKKWLVSEDPRADTNAKFNLIQMMNDLYA
ncbi:MAG: hypothetical protein AAF696_22130 [Bacteroidota bacterium]